jgi:hypothetical protein
MNRRMHAHLYFQRWEIVETGDHRQAYRSRSHKMEKVKAG